MFGSNRIIAVIPARGGSKRIPKKNIYPLNGKPMIQWTIEAATACNYIDKTVVSTDSEEIRKVCIDLGLEMPFLRDKASDDISPVVDATLACLEQAEKIWGKFDVVIQLMPNCPLRTERIISEGIEQFFKQGEKAQISFFDYGWMNPWWAHKLGDNLSPNPIFKEALSSRSQDLQKLYCPSGAVWIANVEDLRTHKTFYFDDYKAYLIDWQYAVDIDDLEDLKMAEAVFRVLEK